MKTGLLRFVFTLMVPVGIQAATLEAVPVDAYRPLKAAEAELLGEGFEAAWLARLGEALGSDISLLDAPESGQLRFGKLGSGAAYYSSEIAALVASKAGPTDWAGLAGKPFCSTTGSPHAEVIAARFGGVARIYPSAAQALIGLKLGECQAVVGERILLQQIAELPEWRRYDRLLPALEYPRLTLRVAAADAALQQRIEEIVASPEGQNTLAEVTQHWIDEVAFQAYVLADTLDCH
ncbi:transporter substrate-binding domain-containing protein [Stutzerimonas stutzeri]|uniref:transporter substrate-binding domain-containing protein n=1 Tax=Stutzerimonas stutzeri TaxID=316 RepID=UPI0002E3CB20|nr:transporter substrate-binding domain-containing protein [Stutzerimonas stutzeri]